MGSGGRRTAERRVGDEEMEEENNRILVVKSDEKWMKCNIIAVIEIGVCWMVSIISGDVIFIVFLGILLSTISLWILWSEGKVLILDETGCTVKFLKYKKYMKWDEIETKQLRVNMGMYYEGVLLSRCKEKPPNTGKSDWYVLKHPLSSFQVNFTGMHNPHLSPNRYVSVKAEMCAIDKELFLKKMEEWGVKIDSVRTLDRKIFFDKKGKMQTKRNGYGWKCLTFCLGIVLIYLLELFIFVLKSGVLIVVFSPFLIALFIILSIVCLEKSYILKMDKKGCTRKVFFLSKHYPWKDLRVKLVASEESHCGEGVLFIKKKSGNSSSASETFSYASLHPYSSFVANFEVPGKMYGEKDALHEISKELFLEKMKEWGVEVEGLQKEE